MNPIRAGVIPATLVGMALAGVAVLQQTGATEEAARQLIRLSAISSLLLFSLAWSASSLATFFPSGWRFVMRARRRIGIAFAMSHTLHFATIAWLVEAFYGGDWSQVELLGGGLIYLFIYLMLLTSNDASVRLLGVRRWRRLHLLGGYLVWIGFTQSYVANALVEGRGGHYPVFAALCVGLLLLRIAAWWRRRPGRAVAASG